MEAITDRTFMIHFDNDKDIKSEKSLQDLLSNYNISNKSYRSIRRYILDVYTAINTDGLHYTFNVSNDNDDDDNNIWTCKVHSITS